MQNSIYIWSLHHLSFGVFLTSHHFTPLYKFIEFVRLVHCHPELVGTAAFIRPYFEEADADDNQTLDEDELCSMLKSLLTDLAVPASVQAEIQASSAQILKTMDTDGDGRIDFPEMMQVRGRDEAWASS